MDNSAAFERWEDSQTFTKFSFFVAFYSNFGYSFTKIHK